jgi:hypothetical protein
MCDSSGDKWIISIEDPGIAEGLAPIHIVQEEELSLGTPAGNTVGPSEWVIQAQDCEGRGGCQQQKEKPSSGEERALLGLCKVRSWDLGCQLCAANQHVSRDQDRKHGEVKSEQGLARRPNQDVGKKQNQRGKRQSDTRTQHSA